MNKLTAKESILRALQEGEKITPYDALANHGAFRLSAVVYTLRAEGHSITSRRIAVRTKRGKTAFVAEYSMAVR